jgi:ABC-type lipoprotein release transport system permease subunit
LALGLARLLRSLLFEVGPADPLSLVVAGAALLLVGIAAAFVPAWRASRTHPSLLLRDV